MLEQLWTDMARRMDEATQAKDWAALTFLDAALLKSLNGLVRTDLSAGETLRLAAVNLSHARARQRCEEELAVLSESLARLEASREGLQAYAASEAWQGEGE